MAPIRDGFIHVGTLAELKTAGKKVVMGRHAPLLVIHHDGQVKAVDNRCPHLGFPLDQGSIQDGILTCHWHHARFDVSSGCTFDLWADDVPTAEVAARGRSGVRRRRMPLRRSRWPLAAASRRWHGPQPRPGHRKVGPGRAGRRHRRSYAAGRRRSVRRPDARWVRRRHDDLHRARQSPAPSARRDELSRSLSGHPTACRRLSGRASRGGNAMRSPAPRRTSGPWEGGFANGLRCAIETVPSARC